MSTNPLHLQNVISDCMGTNEAGERIRVIIFYDKNKQICTLSLKGNENFRINSDGDMEPISDKADINDYMRNHVKVELVQGYSFWDEFVFTCALLCSIALAIRSSLNVTASPRSGEELQNLCNLLISVFTIVAKVVLSICAVWQRREMGVNNWTVGHSTLPAIDVFCGFWSLVALGCSYTASSCAFNDTFVHTLTFYWSIVFSVVTLTFLTKSWYVLNLLHTNEAQFPFIGALILTDFDRFFVQ